MKRDPTPQEAAEEILLDCWYQYASYVGRVGKTFRRFNDSISTSEAIEDMLCTCNCKRGHYRKCKLGWIHKDDFAELKKEVG